jgi:hypothetical protein
MQFNVTYERVTEESAEHGEAEETGFELKGVSLRKAYDFLRWNGDHCEPSDNALGPHSWLTFYGEQDFRDGSHTNYGLHFPRNLTASTRRRIARVFHCYNVR